LTASQISENLGIARYNVSRDLNQLMEENLVLKISGRPVYFLARKLVEDKLGKRIQTKGFESLASFKQLLNEDFTQEEDYPFSELVGYKGSLANAVKQAKAALLYPPNGLHT